MSKYTIYKNPNHNIPTTLKTIKVIWDKGIVYGIKKALNKVMNKEQQEIINEVYEKYHQENKHVMYLTYLLKEEFINRIKKDSEFSNKWGLTIEERELDQFERWELANLTPNMSEIDWCNKFCDEQNIPTKLITITYNDKIIVSYK